MTARRLLLCMGVTCCLGSQALAQVQPADRSLFDAYWEELPSAAAAAKVRGDLNAWRAERQAPFPACLVPATSIEGIWIASDEPAGGCIQLRALGKNRYSLLLAADGHHGGWRMRRTATLSTGVVTLSGPVLDYERPPYARIFAIASGDDRFLVPEPGVRELLATKACSTSPPTWNIGHAALEYYRPTPDNELYCRQILGIGAKGK